MQQYYHFSFCVKSYIGPKSDSYADVGCKPRATKLSRDMCNESARGNVQEKVTKVVIQQIYATSKSTNFGLNQITHRYIIVRSFRRHTT